jgi:hypothetical protein
VEGEDLSPAAERTLSPDDHLVAGDRRRGPGVVARDATGGRNARPPPLLTGHLLDGIEVAGPVREVHRVAVDRRRRRHVSAGRELPFFAPARRRLLTLNVFSPACQRVF